MAVAVVREQVMLLLSPSSYHLLPVLVACLVHCVVPGLRCHVLMLQTHQLLRSPKREVVDRDVIGPSEVLDHPVRPCTSSYFILTNPGVPNKRQKPSDDWERGPHDAVGIAILLSVELQATAFYFKVRLLRLLSFILTYRAMLKTFKFRGFFLHAKII